MIKRTLTIIATALLHIASHAQSEVMLQGFYWDSFSDTRWTKLTSQADDLARYFNLVWIPNSGFCSNSSNMGYMPMYYFNHNSTFGTEAELRTMITEFKKRGLGTVADIVVNHHNTEGWFGFPAETYNGATYQLQSTDICRNDDSGSTLIEANKQGVSLSANNDTGEDWSGCRDLDHNSANVNKVLKAYLNFLIDDLGYTGFRYDMVKGYSASFVADYNATVKPAFSVGEYWDGSTKIKKWIDGTKADGKPQSSAFDFQFRYRVCDAIKTNNWTTLADNPSNADGRPLIYEEAYRPYAVTFVENHDTERRENDEQDPLKADTLAANAYMLAMPGTPCVFLKHWIAVKSDLKQMIEARRLAGITSSSKYEQLKSEPLYYAVKTTGTKGELICVVGKTPQAFTAPDGFVPLCSSKNYTYYINKEAYADWDSTLARIKAETEAEKQAEEDEKNAFVPHTVTVYVKADFTPLYLYVWDSNNATLNGSWPGKQLTAANQTTINGETWYCQTFQINTYGYHINIIFNQGNGKPQTADITNLTQDCYFTAHLNGGSVIFNDVTTTVGIDNIELIAPKQDTTLYDLTGRRIATPQHGSIYIKNNKKYIAR